MSVVGAVKGLTQSGNSKGAEWYECSGVGAVVEGWWGLGAIAGVCGGFRSRLSVDCVQRVSVWTSVASTPAPS